MIQEESAILWEMTVCMILSKKVHINMRPILYGYRDNGKKKVQAIHSNSPVKKQGYSGEIGNTLGNDSMCDSKQKSAYEHGSDFERLPRYGKKNIRTIRSKSPVKNKVIQE